jgi:hypothetical protein
MTIATSVQQISRRPSVGVRKVWVGRLARSAITAAVLAIWAWLGALLLQALEAGLSR